MRPEKELHKDFEARIWRERCHVVRHGPDEGKIFIPPMAFKKSLESVAKYLSIQVPGKGKATWTKHFVSGILVVEPLVLPILVKDVDHEWVFVPSDGRPGGKTRVDKCFPLIPEWEGVVTFFVLDDIIVRDVFEYHISQAGQFKGVGRFRPENGGYYGRYSVQSVEWEE